jgi:hypothetical protein
VRTSRQYNNGTILTPHKCGTKYLNQVFNCSKQENVFSLKDLHRYDFKWLIVRDPYEHLLSALTNVYNNREESITLDELMNKFINGLDAHWIPDFYKVILSYSENHSLTLVKLSDLSSFVEHELKLVPPPKLGRYGTQNFFITKNDLIDKIKTEYPSEWDTLMKMVETETTRYNLLFDRCNVYNLN